MRPRFIWGGGSREPGVNDGGVCAYIVAGYFRIDAGGRSVLSNADSPLFLQGAVPRAQRPHRTLHGGTLIKSEFSQIPLSSALSRMPPAESVRVWNSP